jgi:hypothetical protein
MTLFLIIYFMNALTVLCLYGAETGKDVKLYVKCILIAISPIFILGSAIISLYQYQKNARNKDKEAKG